MALKGNGEIVFVQGESYEYTVKFDRTVAALISKVEISSVKLGLTAEMIRQTGAYSYWFKYLFGAAQTAAYPEGATTYDVTVTFNDGTVEIETGIRLEVIGRKNPPKEA